MFWTGAILVWNSMSKLTDTISIISMFLYGLDFQISNKNEALYPEHGTLFQISKLLGPMGEAFQETNYNKLQSKIYLYVVIGIPTKNV